MRFYTEAEVRTALLVAGKIHPGSDALLAVLLGVDLGPTEDVLPGWPEKTLSPPLGGWSADRPLRDQ